ncbi:MAG: ATP-binding protein, partial [Pseudomonadota bacterium]
INRSGAALLKLAPTENLGRPFTELAPEFAEIVAAAALDPTTGVERPIRLIRDNEERELLARIAAERLDEDEGGAVVGYVVTLDDVTDLVTAQRMAAWGDVARRIAHEIKNPLTPIQLAAERLRRKYSDRLGEDADLFDRYTETIVRQTGDIGRMVDAFVRFAKMPSPKMADEDLGKLLQEAVLLQREARSHISYSVETPETPVIVRADRGQIMQAFTNVLQNAADSLQARLAADEEAGLQGPPAEIRATLCSKNDKQAIVEVSDNGVGLPVSERRRLLEPYVTTREKGAGLGLAIVLKIIEEHNGELGLLDAEPFSEGARPGARARFVLPLAPAFRASGAEAAPEDPESRAADGADAPAHEAAS